jgi:hypothetical protein
MVQRGGPTLCLAGFSLANRLPSAPSAPSADGYTCHTPKLYRTFPRL